MASATLNESERWAPGLTIGAYLRSNWATWQLPPSGTAVGAAATTAVVSATGTVAFAGLADATKYYAAQSTGAGGYVAFSTPTAPASGSQLTTPNVQTASYTLAAADASLAVELNSASATVLTVAAEVTVPFPIGTVIEVARLGAGTVTIAPAGGVVFRAPGGLLALRAQYSTASLRKRAADEWSIAGDLA